MANSKLNTLFSLKEGFVLNPLLKLPRNGPCVCNSGKKWKKCCMPRVSRHVPDLVALKISEEMKGLKYEKG